MRKILFTIIVCSLTFIGQAQMSRQWEHALDSIEGIWNHQENSEATLQRLLNEKSKILEAGGLHSDSYMRCLFLLNQVCMTSSDFSDISEQSAKELSAEYKYRQREQLSHKRDSLYLVEDKTDSSYIRLICEFALKGTYWGEEPTDVIKELTDLKYSISIKKGKTSHEYFNIVYTLSLLYDPDTQGELRRATLQEVAELMLAQIKRQEFDQTSETSMMAMHLVSLYKRELNSNLGVDSDPLLLYTQQRLNAFGHHNHILVTEELMIKTFLENLDSTDTNKFFKKFLRDFSRNLNAWKNEGESLSQKPEPPSLAQVFRNVADSIRNIREMSPEEYGIYMCEQLYREDSNDLIRTFRSDIDSNSIPTKDPCIELFASQKEILNESFDALIKANEYQAKATKVSGIDSVYQTNWNRALDSHNLDGKAEVQWKQANQEQIDDFVKSVDSIYHSEESLHFQLDKFLLVYKKYNSIQNVLSKDHISILRNYRFQPNRLRSYLEELKNKPDLGDNRQLPILRDLVQKEYSRLKNIPNADKINKSSNHLDQLALWAQYRNTLLNIALSGYKNGVIDIFGETDSNFININELMAFKGADLRSKKLIRDILTTVDSDSLVEKHIKLSERMKNLSELSALNNLELDSIGYSESRLEDDIKSYREDYDDFLKYLAPYVSANVTKNQWSITLEDIQGKLDSDEAFIDIERIRTPNETIYLIAISTSKTKKIIQLKNGTHLEGIGFQNYISSTRQHPKSISRSRGVDVLRDEQASNPIDESYSSYWASINQELNGIKKIYLLPDGVYHKLNIATLFNPDSNDYLINELKIIRLNDILDIRPYIFNSPQNIQDAPNNGFHLFGNPSYGNSALKGTNSSLPHTKLEVQQIDSLFKSLSLNSQVYLGENATETRIKLLENPKGLHIASHGFFIDSTRMNSRLRNDFNTRTFLEHPLLRSGVILGDDQNNDGILTAEEVSHLNLQHTEIVVLSACETGLGKLAHGEGIMGLQRAFSIAGVKTVIMSLWKVDDKATRELITIFYQNWLVLGQSKMLAFENAQKALKEKYPSPYYWGAFIMVGS